MLEIFAEPLEQLHLFRWRDKYKSCFLSYVCELLQPMAVPHGDPIYLAGQQEPFHIYSIISGAVEAMGAEDGRLKMLFTKGMIFGLESRRGRGVLVVLHVPPRHGHDHHEKGHVVVPRRHGHDHNCSGTNVVSHIVKTIGSGGSCRSVSSSRRCFLYTRSICARRTTPI